MKVLIRAAVPVVYLCLTGLVYGQNRSSASLLVLSKQEHTLSVVDPSSLRVVAKVPVGDDPQR